MENFELRTLEAKPLEEIIRGHKGFSFDLMINDDINTSKISRLSGSRYKQKNLLLFHVCLKNEEQNWRQTLREQGYEVWLKDRVDKEASIKFEDEHSISNDMDVDHVKLADKDLDNFSEDSFLEPLRAFFRVLKELGYNVDQINDVIPLKRVWQTKDLEEILSAISDSEYVFPEELVINLHNCLNALAEKHFLILTGVSGTGKTKFTQIYVNALYGLPPGDRNNPFFALIPVQPQWSDRTGLLGYFNPITGKYHRPLFLEHLLKARNDAEHSYFVCLDEMNLAVVEHYFADILSVMESNQKIQRKRQMKCHIDIQ